VSDKDRAQLNMNMLLIAFGALKAIAPDNPVTRLIDKYLNEQQVEYVRGPGEFNFGGTIS
jgi:hypothetical protein